MTRVASAPFDARLVASRALSPVVRELSFERADGAAMAFEPGQWVNLVLPVEGGDIKRAYSIASAPRAGGFDLAVTRVEGGPGSNYLHALPPDSLLRAIGPQGLFTRDVTDGRPSLFIGTGTGVAPLRSMLMAALAAGAAEPLWLLFGARSEHDLLYGDELAALEREHANLRVFVTLSRPSDAWTGRRGHVQAHLAEVVASLRELALRPEAFSLGETAKPPLEAYVCGLDRMVSSVKSALRDELGFERRQVHVERYDGP